MLMEGLAKKIAQRVVPIEEEVAIALPRGKKFSEIKKLAEAKRWGQVLELAEKMEVFPKADDDSYRQYAIGVGHEAIAYTQAKGANEIQDALTRAQVAYSKAKETNRGEKKFLDPEIRLQESIEHVITIQEVMRGGRKPKDEPAPPAPTEFNNQFLLHLFKVLRRSEKFITNQIETVADPKFDDSPSGQTMLFDGGLSEDVVMAVSKRMAMERSKKTDPVVQPQPVAIPQVSTPPTPPTPAPKKAVVPIKPAPPSSPAKTAVPTKK